MATGFHVTKTAQTLAGESFSVSMCFGTKEMAVLKWSVFHVLTRLSRTGSRRNWMSF